VQHAEARLVGRPIDRAKDQAILDAARRLLLRDGLRAFTVEAVVHAAGVSKVTLSTLGTAAGRPWCMRSSAN